MSESRKRKRKRKLEDAYRFPGCRPDPVVRGVFGDPKARVIRLIRRSKKRSAVVVGERNRDGTTGECGVFAIWAVGRCGSTWRWKSGGSNADGVDE
jgi:hypothetical protein